MKVALPSLGLRGRALCFVVLAGAGLLSLYAHYAELVVSRQARNVEADGVASARLAAAELDAWFESGAEQLRAVAGLPGVSIGLLGQGEDAVVSAVSQGRSPAQYETLHYLLMVTRFNAGVMVFGETGRLVFVDPVDRGRIGEGLNWLPAVRHVLGGDEYRGVLALPGGGKRVAVGVPVASPDGGTLGGLVGFVDLGSAGLPLQAAAGAAGTQIYVLDRQHTVLWSGPGSGRSPGDASHPRLGSVTFEDGGRFSLAEAALETTPLQVVVERDVATVVADLQRTLRGFLLGGISILLGLIAVSVPVFSRFLSPLAALATVAKQLGEGRLFTPLPNWARGEVGVLVHAFGEMQQAVRQSYRGILHALVAALDARERETRNHSDRVAQLSCLVAAAMGLDGEDLLDVEIGSLLHDIGKIGIPDAVLLKPGALDEQEWAVMKRHSEVGYTILDGVQVLARARPIVRHHHERFEGGGYPDGLIGDQIPIGARIFAIADTVDAITHDRPYRKGRGLDVAIAEVERCRGTQFDPAVVDAFRSVPIEDIAEAMGIAVPEAATERRAA